MAIPGAFSGAKKGPIMMIGPWGLSGRRQTGDVVTSGVTSSSA